jgi:2-phosphosulfolactate phosphatase
LDGRVFKPGHDQSAHRVRMEWGPTGATAVAADVTAVVDVLSFTTTVCIAVERGIAVLPYVWKDERAREYAAARDAVLAVGRFEARSLARDEPRGISLSPAEMATAELTGVERIVLPSPNGSTICFALAETGATVVAASLRNASAVAAYLAPLLRGGASCAVVAAGERWPDGTLRPCVEDLWGAGAVIAGLVDAGRTGLSPEARVAEHAFRAVRADLAAELAACAGGAELAAAGYADDVEVAGQLDVSRVVPVLRGGGFPGGQD